MTSNSSPPSNAPLVELKKINQELKALRNDLSELREDVQRLGKVNLTDQIAKGVVIAGLFWFGIVFVLQLLSNVW